MGTENFENENFEEKMKIPANFYQNSLCFSQNQWTFEWGLKILKMKIPANFYQNSLCFSQNQWTFEWGLKILKMKILKKK